MSTLLEHSESATALDVTLIDSDDQLRTLAEEWDALAGDQPFRSFAWAEAWWRHYRHARARLFVLTARDSIGRLVGLAPWYQEHAVGRGRTVRFLGSGEVCSDYLSILCEPAWADAVADRLADWLFRVGKRDWDQLELTGVAADDEPVATLGDALVERGLTADRRGDTNCWRVTLPVTWNEYLSKLSKSRRDRVRSLHRRYFETGRAVLRTVGSAVDLARGLEILIDLHQKRRLSLSEPGCFASCRFTAFHREMAQRLLKTGKLRLLWIELDGRPAAVEYGFLGGDTIYFYQTGFDPELAEDRPGWLCAIGSLRRAIDEGYRSFDFLRGDESYKASWRADAHPLVQIRIAGAGSSARLRLAAWQAGQGVKKLLRGTLTRFASRFHNTLHQGTTS